MLEHRLMTGDQREFVVAPWSGKNESGYDPLDDKVLVLMDEHSATYGSDGHGGGAIVLPQQALDRQSMAAETGTIVAIGPAAFVYNDEATRRWEGRRPEPGDRVYVSRYSGQLLQGVDTKVYRLMSQSCVGAVAQPLALAEMVEAGSEKPRRRRRVVAA